MICKVHGSKIVALLAVCIAVFGFSLICFVSKNEAKHYVISLASPIIKYDDAGLLSYLYIENPVREMQQYKGVVAIPVRGEEVQYKIQHMNLSDIKGIVVSVDIPADVASSALNNVDGFMILSGFYGDYSEYVNCIDVLT